MIRSTSFPLDARLEGSSSQVQIQSLDSLWYRPLSLLSTSRRKSATGSHQKSSNFHLHFQTHSLTEFQAPSVDKFPSSSMFLNVLNYPAITVILPSTFETFRRRSRSRVLHYLRSWVVATQNDAARWTERERKREREREREKRSVEETWDR